MRSWRQTHRLTQEEFAGHLDVTREWISRLEKGDREVSAEVYLKFEALKRDPRFAGKGDLDRTSPIEPEVTAQEDAAPYGTAESLARETRAVFDDLLQAAGDNVARHGWLNEELKQLARRKPFEDEMGDEAKNLIEQLRSAGVLSSPDDLPAQKKKRA